MEAAFHLYACAGIISHMHVSVYSAAKASAYGRQVVAVFGFPHIP